MADMFSILQNNYLTVGSTTSTPATKYVAVDPTQYNGTWTGQYGDGTKFSVQISNTNGFRATVHYQSGTTNNYGQVLINNSSFRIGDSKFVLGSPADPTTGAPGTAVMSTVITDPVTGATTVQRAYATQA